MKELLTEADNIVIIQLAGIIIVLIVQFAQTVRAYITARVSSNQNIKIIEDIKTIKEEMSEMKEKNQTEHKSLVNSTNKIDEKIEHNSFIPAFEIAIETYINNIVSGFSFSSKALKTLALTNAMKYKDVFTNILKFGFDKFNSSYLIDNFDIQDMRLAGILDSHKIKIDKEKLITFIKLEQESFLIEIKQIVSHKSNGERQDSFDKLCKNFIFTLIKEISVL